MSLIKRYLLVFTALCTIDGTVAARPTECQMWDGAAASTMDQEFLNVTCAKNTLCTGFRCSGSLLFENLVFSGSEPFGFAVEFIPCSYPLVLRLLVNSTSLNFMKLIGVHGRNEEAILLVIPGTGDFEEDYGRVNMVWNAVLKPVKYFVALQMNFTRIHLSGEFPPIPIVPLQNYPVPNCQYAPRDDSSPVTKKPSEDNDEKCKGDECDDDNDNGDGDDGAFNDNEDSATVGQKRSFGRSYTILKYNFVLKICAGVGVIIFVGCLLGGIVLAHNRRRAMKLKKVEVLDDSKFESEEEDEMPDSSRDMWEDKRNLLRV